MDKRTKQKLVNEHLEIIIKKTNTLEDLGYLKHFIELYEKEGYDVEKYKIKEKYKESLLTNIIYN